jgi:hypothetical protein
MESQKSEVRFQIEKRVPVGGFQSEICNQKSAIDTTTSDFWLPPGEPKLEGV